MLPYSWPTVFPECSSLTKGSRWTVWYTIKVNSTHVDSLSLKSPTTAFLSSQTSPEAGGAAVSPDVDFLKGRWLIPSFLSYLPFLPFIIISFLPYLLSSFLSSFPSFIRSFLPSFPPYPVPFITWAKIPRMPLILTLRCKTRRHRFVLTFNRNKIHFSFIKYTFLK